MTDKLTTHIKGLRYYHSGHSAYAAKPDCIIDESPLQFDYSLYPMPPSKSMLSSILFTPPTKSDIRERLAALAHDQWSGWMKYLFKKCQMNDDGTVTIPAWAVERWSRQMLTGYKDLPEDEKESDRKEADRYLMIINENGR